MKYGQIESLRQHYSVAAIYRVFDVSESGYHAWRERPPSRRAQENARLEVEIRAAHQRTRETYGPERLQSDLADHGIRAGVDRDLLQPATKTGSPRLPVTSCFHATIL